MANAFRANLEKLGCVDIVEEEEGVGSTDMGNVSQVVPAIHPHIAITEGNVPGHSIEFLKAAGSERGKQAALLAAKALAFTGLDLMTDEELMGKVKDEFEKTVKQA